MLGSGKPCSSGQPPGHDWHVQSDSWIEGASLMTCLLWLPATQKLPPKLGRKLGSLVRNINTKTQRLRSAVSLTESNFGRGIKRDILENLSTTVKTVVIASDGGKPLTKSSKMSDQGQPAQEEGVTTRLEVRIQKKPKTLYMTSRAPYHYKTENLIIILLTTDFKGLVLLLLVFYKQNKVTRGS